MGIVWFMMNPLQKMQELSTISLAFVFADMPAIASAVQLEVRDGAKKHERIVTQRK